MCGHSFKSSLIGWSRMEFQTSSSFKMREEPETGACYKIENMYRFLTKRMKNCLISRYVIVYMDNFIREI